MNDSAPFDTPAPKAPLPPVSAEPGAGHCANCGATLHGPHCHQCGQPVKGMIRPLSGLTADVIDSVFNIDSRILRTLGPLYFRPGFLTTEYFIGRRVRYVTPFRLFFFLTVIAFLITQVFSEQVGLTATIGDNAKRGSEALATIQAAAAKAVPPGSESEDEDEGQAEGERERHVVERIEGDHRPEADDCERSGRGNGSGGQDLPDPVPGTDRRHCRHHRGRRAASGSS